MVEPRHESAVLDHVPRTNSNSDFAVGDVVAVITRQAFDRLELENLLVIFSEVRRTRAPNSDVVDIARLFPTVLEVALTHIGHTFLGEVELVVVRSEEHTSELQSLRHLVCRLLLEKKNQIKAAPGDLHDRGLAREEAGRVG